MTLLTATTVLSLGLVAMADPAGETSYLPIALETAGGSGPTVVVERGDHLWKISQTGLDRALGRQAGLEEVARYWRDVIDANLGQLKSGDPDLIYPGEVIRLPATQP